LGIYTSSEVRLFPVNFAFHQRALNALIDLCSYIVVLVSLRLILLVAYTAQTIGWKRSPLKWLAGSNVSTRVGLKTTLLTTLTSSSDNEWWP